MAEYHSSTQLATRVDAVFDYLSEAEHLPDYAAFIGDVHATGPGEVHAAAHLPDGRTVAGESHWRVDALHRRIDWDAEDGSGYHGTLLMRAHPDGTHVRLVLHTPHDPDPAVQRAADEAMAALHTVLVTNTGAV
jgi:uncharacterized membrane protein